MKCTRCKRPTPWRHHLITNEKVCNDCFNDELGQMDEIKDHSWLYKKLNIRLPFLMYPLMDQLWTFWFYNYMHFYQKYENYKKL